MGIVGSRNLSGEYFDALASGNFSDVDLLVVAAVVPALSRSFDDYWYSAAAVPWYQAAGLAAEPASSAPATGPLGPAEEAADGQPTRAWALEHWASAAASLIWAKAAYIDDAPQADKQAIASGIEHGFSADRPSGAVTRRELLIVTPYFVLGTDGLQHLADMLRRGLRVALLTNSLAATDSLAAHAGYARQREQLLRMGVEVFEFRPEPGLLHDAEHRWGETSLSTLHTKLVVRDGAAWRVGWRSVLGWLVPEQLL